MIAELRLLLDSGLVVLIWMVQLVVYPSFKYFATADLVNWHQKYTVRITYIVMPLMLGQLLVSGFQFYETQSFYSVGSFVMVLALWATTFSIFVPLHAKIGSNSFSPEDLQRLEKRNWIRTVLWNLICVWSVLEIFYC
ncbi:MAG: DMSO reductase anchor subunit [Psychroserpens sp.]|jgi:DMSO reductase anchor subunit